MSDLEEIEITPEMIEAGVKAFCLFDPDDRPDELVREVFRQMLLVAVEDRQALR